MEEYVQSITKSLIWITMINGGYVHYTKNFLKSMELSKVDFKLIVYCLDEEAQNALKDCSNAVCVPVDFLDRTMSTAMKVWGDAEYVRITYTKLDVIAHALRTTSIPSIGVTAVGYIDTDIVLFADPTPVMLDAMNEHPDIDVFSQCDELGLACSNPIACRTICSGVIVFRNKPSLMPLFVYDETTMSRKGDQDHMLHALRRQKQTCRTISKEVMPNGSFLKEAGIPKTACLVHFNCMVGNKKEASMRRHGVWYI